MLLDITQWLGCFTGIAGAFLLALNNKNSGWGFALFLISNAFWIAYGIETKATGLIVTQSFFSVTSGLGIYRWLYASRKNCVRNS